MPASTRAPADGASNGSWVTAGPKMRFATRGPPASDATVTPKRTDSFSASYIRAPASVEPEPLPIARPQRSWHSRTAPQHREHRPGWEGWYRQLWPTAREPPPES